MYSFVWKVYYRPMTAYVLTQILIYAAVVVAVIWGLVLALAAVSAYLHYRLEQQTELLQRESTLLQKETIMLRAETSELEAMTRARRILAGL